MAPFIIAEAGVNHNGDIATALALVDAAAETGADAVKFQTFSADRLARKGTETAAYQKQMTGASDQHEMLKSLEMSVEMHDAVLARCQDRGIEFMSTGFDEEALDYLVGIGIRRIKVPSGEITNLPFLRHMAATGLPIILSTGMASMDEVETAVATIRDAHAAAEVVQPLRELLTVLHCTSNYPTEPENVNLRAMLTIAQRTGLPVGYSDHTLGTTVAIAAVALGAVMIEKHFTLDRTMPGPDHAASLEPADLAAMVAAIRDLGKAMGDGVKAPTESELPVRVLVRKSITARRTIRKDAPIVREDLVMLRPGNGIPPAELDRIVGRTAARDIAEGELLQWPDLR